MSSNTFYMLVADALISHKRLSVVRMGDGELQLLNGCYVTSLNGAEGLAKVDSHSEEWLRKLGCFGIQKRVLTQRIFRAAMECDYFAPSVSGIVDPKFAIGPKFEIGRYPRGGGVYVDNFFVNAWTEEMKIELFKQAGHVLFIHRNQASADAMQVRAKYGLGVRVTYLNLSSWEQADEVIAKAKQIDAPLVLFSAGPAAKYIGPAIANGEDLPKVTLDIGNAADYWLLTSLKDVAQGRR